MKRAGLAMLALGAMLAAIGQSGCVSLDKYNKLHSSWQACNSDRDALKSENDVLKTKVAGANQQLSIYEAQIRDKDGRIGSLNVLVEKLGRERDEWIAKATAAQPPNITINPPSTTTVKLAKAVDEALKAFATTHPGLLEYDAANGLVRFSSDVLFDLGKSDVKPEIARLLGDFAEVITIPEAQQYDVLVVGHTDNVRIGRPETRAVTPTNWHLSCYRAVSVLLVLQNAKVDAKRLGAMGFGEERPRVANKTGGTKENRRVEVYLVPKGSMTTTSQAPIIRGEALAVGQ